MMSGWIGGGVGMMGGGVPPSGVLGGAVPPSGVLGGAMPPSGVLGGGGGNSEEIALDDDDE